MHCAFALGYVGSDAFPHLLCRFDTVHATGGRQNLACPPVSASLNVSWKSQATSRHGEEDSSNDVEVGMV